METPLERALRALDQNEKTTLETLCRARWSREYAAMRRAVQDKEESQ
jgi:hypothetical protein